MKVQSSIVFLIIIFSTANLFAADFLYEEDLSKKELNSCDECPQHLKLTSSINQILHKLRTDPNVVKHDELPVSINRLKFLFYVVKSQTVDGKVKCERFKASTFELQTKKFSGKMDLMAEEIFKFDGAMSFQLLDPKKDEIIYYYRGMGNQKNIIIQAVLSREGGKFRYYNYQPSEQEKNPYNLPDTGRSVKKADTAVLKGDVSHFLGSSINMNALTKISLKGNETTLQMEDINGKKMVVVNVSTSIKGEVSKKVIVPLEIKISNQDIKGKFETREGEQLLTLAVQENDTQHVRTQLKRNSKTNQHSYSVTRDFPLDKSELITVAVGQSEDKKGYASYQHRKSFKEALTLILDMRLDHNRRASFTYQFKGKF
jgi:hypothetical protein